MANVISVNDFLAAYKTSYDAIKSFGTHKRGEKAYENLFAVADRTDDMQEAQLIIEKEGLMIKLTTEDALDIHEQTLAKLDPLDEITTVLTNLNIDMYNNALSVEDIAYKSQFLELDTIRLTAIGKIKMLIAATLADLLIKYDKGKRSVREWADDSKAKAGLEVMAKYRTAIKELLEIASEELGTDWQELLDNQFFMIWMLSPQNIDEYGRTKKTMHPDTIEAYKDMLAEITSDMKLSEILLKEQEHGMCYLPE